MAAVLIAGCGFVGSELARRLLAEQHSVYGLRRDVSKLPAGTAAVQGDLTTSESFDGMPAALDSVVFCAAPDRGSEQTYRAIYVDGLRRVLDAVAVLAAPPARLILVSSTGVYGQNAGEQIDEDSPTVITDAPSASARYSGRLLCESERIAEASGMTTTRVRFGGIYGPGRTALVDRVYRREAKLTNEPTFTNRIHRDDCASAIRHLLALQTPPECVIGVDSDPAERNNVITWLAERMGVTLERAEPGETVSPNKRCLNRLLTSTGYVFEYPSYREGYPAIVDAYLKSK